MVLNTNMGSYDGASESRLRSNSDQVESRLDLNQVPEQINRIFFGSGSGKPSYSGVYSPPSTGYGVPAANPITNYNPGGYYYQGYEDDVYLLMKLGIAGIIVFIILAIIIIVALLCLCCFQIFKPKKDSGRNRTDQTFKVNTFPQKDNNGLGVRGANNPGFSGHPAGNISGTGFGNSGTGNGPAQPAGTGRDGRDGARTGDGTPAVLSRNPGLQNLSSILDTPSEDDTLRGGNRGRNSSPRTPGQGGGGSRGRSRSKGRGRDTPRAESGSSLDTSSVGNLNQGTSTWNDRPWNKRTGISGRDLEPQISSESNNISQNRSISYYEVPVATTMSTFTYDRQPATAVNSISAVNPGGQANVTGALDGQYNVSSGTVTGPGLPNYTRYSTINRDRGLV